MKTLMMTVGLLAIGTSSALAGTCPQNKTVSIDDVTAAQSAWGKGIVAIGGASDPGKAALDHLENLYGYENGQVLFKPTKAAENQFRGTKDEALSYFVGGSVNEDKGFALAPYTNVRFENEDVVLGCGSALAMGNYYFTTTQGEEIKVEYSFGYVKDENGNLKINLHHSSLPFGG